MEIRELSPNEWIKYGILSTFEQVFDSDAPNPAHGKIYGLFDDGEYKGFVLAEQVTVIGQIYIKDAKKSGVYAKSLINFLRRVVPAKQSVAAVASEKRFEMLYRTLGMQKIEGTFFRKN